MDFSKRVRKFVLEIISFIDSLPRDIVCKTVGTQLIRSGTSIGANYFEAKAASSKKEYINFFNYSLKSANESKFWLEMLIESNKCSRERAAKLLDETTQIAKILASSILTLKGKRKLLK